MPRAVTTTVLRLPAAPSPAGVAKQVQTLPTLPSSIPEMVFIINANLGHKRQAHHITKLQTTSVQKLFGNVRMLTLPSIDSVVFLVLLIDLAGLQDSSLNEALKADTNLNATQVWQSAAVCVVPASEEAGHWHQKMYSARSSFMQ